MPLAGRMKLRTFLLLIGGLFALGAAGAFYGVSAAIARAEAERQATAEAARLEAESATRRQAEASAAAAAAQATANAARALTVPRGRPVDDAVTAYLGQPLGSDKKKDTTSGQPYKVNVYQDAGKPVANRAKVDLDRDDRWDEKWTWDAGRYTRQTAPRDDEQYTVVEVWSQGSWVPAP